MDGPPPQLVTDLIARLPVISAIEWVPQTHSTNAVLGAEGGPSGRVLVADVQTAGRGRRGRTWYAPAGSSLMLSVLLRPAMPVATWPQLALAAGSAVIDACRTVLRDVDPARLALKWPNDLLVDGVKVAGVLLESGDGAVVVGTGINTDWRGVGRPQGLIATSLAEAGGADVDRWALLGHLLTALDRHVREADADPGGVVQRYVGDCGTLGAQVIARGPTTVEGTAVGLTPDGHLRIRARDGRQHIVTAGDVEQLR